MSISSSYNPGKALVAILQVVYASATLYNSRGKQIEIYGRAAFSFTVLPYIVMSIINLFGNLLTPDFATLYLVRSPEMDEAESRGAEFDGVIGRVVVDVQTAAERGHCISTVNGRRILEHVIVDGHSRPFGLGQYEPLKSTWRPCFGK